MPDEVTGGREGDLWKGEAGSVGHEEGRPDFDGLGEEDVFEVKGGLEVAVDAPVAAFDGLGRGGIVMGEVNAGLLGAGLEGCGGQAERDRNQGYGANGRFRNHLRGLLRGRLTVRLLREIRQVVFFRIC